MRHVVIDYEMYCTLSCIGWIIGDACCNVLRKTLHIARQRGRESARVCVIVQKVVEDACLADRFRSWARTWGEDERMLASSTKICTTCCCKDTSWGPRRRNLCGSQKQREGTTLDKHQQKYPFRDRQTTSAAASTEETDAKAKKSLEEDRGPQLGTRRSP